MNSIKKKKFPCKDYIKQPYVSFLSKNKNKNKHFCTPPSNLTGIFFFSLQCIQDSCLFGRTEKTEEMTWLKQSLLLFYNSAIQTIIKIKNQQNKELY